MPAHVSREAAQGCTVAVVLYQFYRSHRLGPFRSTASERSDDFTRARTVQAAGRRFRDWPVYVATFDGPVAVVARPSNSSGSSLGFSVAGSLCNRVQHNAISRWRGFHSIQITRYTAEREEIDTRCGMIATTELQQVIITALGLLLGGFLLSGNGRHFIYVFSKTIRRDLL